MSTEAKIPAEHQLLAESLNHAKASARNGVLRSADLDRSHRERLQRSDCLLEVIKGWYLLTSPGAAGSSTAWFGGFWYFLAFYLSDRFGEDGYCLSAESSLTLLSGERTILSQITVITKKASNQRVDLPYQTSLLVYQDEASFPPQVYKLNGLNLMPLPIALVRVAPTYFQNEQLNIEINLKSLPSISDLSRALIALRAPASGNRLAGAFEALGEKEKSQQIVNDMAAAGLAVSPTNPFETKPILLGSRWKVRSPYAGRIQALWERMRSDVIENFPKAPGLSREKPNAVVKVIKELYKQDAYHSLSIEGYQVTENLIQKIETGQWDPKRNADDEKQRDALAAKGYSQCFRQVLDSVLHVLKGENAASVLQQNLQNWYRELFAPLAQAGLIRSTELAGYRDSQVYISQSRHVPPPSSAVVDTMEKFFHLLKDESEPSVRVILGHFIFVYIHPYMDGNGRIGRLIMNLMLISGGYHWTVIRTSERDSYMKALETASTQSNIVPFTKFVASELVFWSTHGPKV